MTQTSPFSTLAARALAVTADSEAPAPQEVAASEPMAAVHATTAAPVASAGAGPSRFEAEGFLAELRANQLAGERAFLQRAQNYQHEPVQPTVYAPPAAAASYHTDSALPPVTSGDESLAAMIAEAFPERRVEPVVHNETAHTVAAASQFVPTLPGQASDDMTNGPTPDARTPDDLAPDIFAHFSMPAVPEMEGRSTQALEPRLPLAPAEVNATGALSLPTQPAAHAPVQAQPAVEAPAQPAVAFEKNLIFSLGNVRYAVPMKHIIEIAELEHYTPVPNVPDFILGITNLRGDILSLVDLNALHGENFEEIPRGSNLLVTSTEGGDLTTCLVVDRVHGVAAVNPATIQHFDKMSNHGLSSFTRGYVTEGEDLLCLIDIETLLRSLELTH